MIHDISKELRLQLWHSVLARLQSGDALITNEDFQGVMEKTYQDLNGTVAPPEVRVRINQMVATVNGAYPETYVARGVQNGVTRAFEAGVRKLQWDEGTVQEKGVCYVARPKSA